MNLSQVDLIAQAVEALTSINDRLAHQLVDEFIDPYWATVEVCDSPYPATDPKHSGFHSMAADLWDLREGK